MALYTYLGPVIVDRHGVIVDDSSGEPVNVLLDECMTCQVQQGYPGAVCDGTLLRLNVQTAAKASVAFDVGTIHEAVKLLAAVLTNVICLTATQEQSYIVLRIGVVLGPRRLYQLRLRLIQRLRGDIQPRIPGNRVE